MAGSGDGSADAVFITQPGAAPPLTERAIAPLAPPIVLPESESSIRFVSATLVDRRLDFIPVTDTGSDLVLSAPSNLGSHSFGGMSQAELQRSLREGAFVDSLDRMREELREDFDLDRSITISVAGVSLGLSVVYVLWLVRGGVLLSSYLSALPAWRLIDPLPVLAHAGGDDDEDDDALDNLAGQPADPLRGSP